MNRVSLRGWEAFDALERLLADAEMTDAILEEPVLCRVQQALENGPRPSALDLAVLIRQVLRFHTLQYGGSDLVRMTIQRGSNWPTEAEWQAVGVKAQAAREKYLLQASPWLPSWLPDVGRDGVDAAAAGCEQRRYMHQVPGDPFLARFGLAEYLSAGQRAAVRAALTTPPGTTLLVCLPTGEGKSLVFQAVAEFGFSEGGHGPGVTLVVTPTVALAMDQERAALEFGMPDIPRAYVGGSRERNNQIAERIAAGTQGLCFASPEAVHGALRSSLMTAAQHLHLRAFVIDEAHLVDAWGANFRPEFQLLSGVRHDLLDAVGPGGRFRTFLLSATVTAETVTTLQRLFGCDDCLNSDGFRICGTVRLRPEIDYWVSQPCSQDEQQSRVLESLHHLPRPAVLYVTEVKHAQWWYRRLTRCGFRRLACVTGQTPSEERRCIVEHWKDRAIDLVVSTSAFGLGIDNPDVRTVIHACLPETLDRFYQEVGRGGRDGRASISLMIYTVRDSETARRLNQRRLISVERGLQRWRAMFEHPSRVHHGGNLFTVRLDVPPGMDERDIDMLSAQNTQWNARTLSLMANARLVSLKGPGVSQMPVDEGMRQTEERDLIWHPVQTVEILDQHHLDPVAWNHTVEPERQRIKSAFYDNFGQMKLYLKQQECVADTLVPLYAMRSPNRDELGIPIAKACGGCPICRRQGVPVWQEYPGSTPPPWSASPLQAPIASLLGADNRLVVFCPTALLSSEGSGGVPRREQRRFRKVLSRLINCGMQNLLILQGIRLDLDALQESAKRPFFVSHHLATSQLPDGPSILLATPNTRIESRELRRPRQPDQARIFFLSEDYPDPDRLSVCFSQTNKGRQWRFDEFQVRMGS